MIMTRIKYESLKSLDPRVKRAQCSSTIERKEKIKSAYGMLERGSNVMQIVNALAYAIGDPIPEDLLDNLEMKSYSYFHKLLVFFL